MKYMVLKTFVFDRIFKVIGRTVLPIGNLINNSHLQYIFYRLCQTCVLYKLTSDILHSTCHNNINRIMKEIVTKTFDYLNKIFLCHL